MESSPHELLGAWESFYVILGSSAAALTGLQFVVMALIADSPSIPGSSEAVAAFGTPNVVHFSQALFVSAMLTAPWPSLWLLAIALSLAGLSGLAYGALTLVRTRRQAAYEPVMEDWIWHIILPLTAYTSLTVASVALTRSPIAALFAIAGVTLLLVFIGIHNAWDTIEYLVSLRRHRSRNPEQRLVAQA